MKKLKLNLDDLKVVSFETTSKNQQQKGTVYGYQCNTQGDCTELCGPSECFGATCNCPSTPIYTCATCIGVPPNCN